MAQAGGTAGTGPSNISVSPSQVHQGALLTVTASGCTGGGTITSTSFPTVTLPAGATTSTTARVNNNATTGTATLTVQCSGRSANASFTVLAGTPAQGGLGGTQGPSTTATAVGGTLTALALATGTGLLLRRRTRPTRT
ncbi:hypothetical protein PV371_39205 [Streptomyces sp. TX20-6-3]|uniref:hypothetical protein n=1 Tax=Streptomyces sp. TX20-6-3 TaxID=3028705 RepID=UPI0029B36AF3|nr:hypothetical protein [Streptomyces sp. TX20-6-3]MDX2565510.1 hypothetical protein [Streptomyces sp. TX20-6-3]